MQCSVEQAGGWVEERCGRVYYSKSLLGAYSRGGRRSIVLEAEIRGIEIMGWEQKGHTTKAGCTICTTTLESLTSSAKALVQVASPPLLMEYVASKEEGILPVKLPMFRIKD